MEIADILVPDAVRSMGSIKSKKRLFQELGDIIGGVYGIDATQTFNALRDRESLGPTGVGNGIALPHARIGELDKVIGTFVRLDKPLEFEAIDRQPVDLVFALFAPMDAGVEHLKALAVVSRSLRDGALCSKLRANDDAATLHAVLTEYSPSQAA